MRKLLFAASILAVTGLWSCQSSEQENVAESAPEIIETPDFNPHPTSEYFTPEESMKEIYVPKGYRLELVASEPMIKEPVTIAWDGNGRMYVAEMLTYMQDADASGEQEPISRISLLEDTDGDGKMDKSSVFIDSLLLPRMIQPVGDELLVNETNTIDIYSYKDTDGDGKADQKKLLYRNENYILTDRNMEHQRSGLDWNLDNWMYVTYDPVRFRYTDGTLKVDTILSGVGGQWGVTHDNYGRIFYSRAGSELAAHQFQINPSYGSLDFPDQYSEEFAEVWPVIATPDVQGGPRRLRPDNTLNHFTATCGQSIFRGDRLPQGLSGDYIVAEPVARIIRRAKVVNVNGKTVLENVYDKQEFISSSDMNFRPVHTATGPDGTLYIVDMHRGIIQQGNWTRPGSFLRHKIDSLGLAKNIGHGRIYRLVHENFEPGPQPRLLDADIDELVDYLDHPNGWWRDNAQKEIIVRGDRSVVSELEDIATGHGNFFWNRPSHLARIHALWTLEGLDAISKEVLTAALKDEHPQVQRTAVWISERYLKQNDEEIIGKVAALKNSENFDVITQVLMSMWQSTSPQAKAIVDEIINKYPEEEMITGVKDALDRNDNIKTYGARLGRMASAERESILRGSEIFKSLCSACHGPDGKGIMIGGTEMPAPPLVGSQRIMLSDRNTTLKILLHGLTGPIEGKTYTSIMAPLEANDDEWIAYVASYIRYEFGVRGFRMPPGGFGGFGGGGGAGGGQGFRGFNNSPVVTVEEVKAVREEFAGRIRPWTLKELGVE